MSISLYGQQHEPHVYVSCVILQPGHAPALFYLSVAIGHAKDCNVMAKIEIILSHLGQHQREQSNKIIFKICALHHIFCGSAIQRC